MARLACFGPLRTELVHSYKWIICRDVLGEEYTFRNVFWLLETEDTYVFYCHWSDNMITEHVWPSKILVHVDYGPLDIKMS